MQITTAVSSSEFDWFTSCRAIDAMVMFNTPFRGQQELSLLGAEQTTSLLVVMIMEDSVLTQDVNTIFTVWRSQADADSMLVDLEAQTAVSVIFG